MKLSDNEFVEWWEKNKVSEKFWSRSLIKGAGMGLMLSFPILLMVMFRGWYKRMPFISGTQLLLILTGCVLVAVFYALLKGRMEWEQHEERYQRLRHKKTEE